MLDLQIQDGVATLNLDDGKRNAMNFDWFEAMNGALDQVEADPDAKVLLIVGREGAFSAGLDLKLLPTLDATGLEDLIRAFAKTMLRIFLLPMPVVGAATGHALGGGTILSMTCDHTVAVDGEFRWGLNEVAIGMPVPSWIVAIARLNVSPTELDGLILSGATIDPAKAVAVGFADEVAPAAEILDRARAAATARIPLAHPAYAATKRFLRGDAADAELARLDAELKALFAG